MLKVLKNQNIDEDLYDEYQIQYIRTPNGEIKVGNSLMDNAVWVMTDVDLDGVLKEWEDKTFYESENRILTPEEISKMMQDVEDACTRFREYVKKMEG